MDAQETDPLESTLTRSVVYRIPRGECQGHAGAGPLPWHCDGRCHGVELVEITALEVDWPLDPHHPSSVHATFGDGAVADYTAYLDTGVPVGSSGTCSLPYLAGEMPGGTTIAQDTAVERALIAAYEGQS